MLDQHPAPPANKPALEPTRTLRHGPRRAPEAVPDLQVRLCFSCRRGTLAERASVRSSPVRVFNRALSASTGSSTAASSFVRQLLDLHEKKMRTCYDAYPAALSESRAKITAGKVTLSDGEVIVLSDQRKENVLKISDTFHLDEIESLVLWLQFLHHRRNLYITKPGRSDHLKAHNTSKEADDEGALDDETFGSLTAFYFEERQSVLVAMASMLHIGESVIFFSSSLDAQGKAER